jgi:hypothetical protein
MQSCKNVVESNSQSKTIKTNKSFQVKWHANELLLVDNIWKLEEAWHCLGMILHMGIMTIKQHQQHTSHTRHLPSYFVAF